MKKLFKVADGDWKNTVTHVVVNGPFCGLRSRIIRG